MSLYLGFVTDPLTAQSQINVRKINTQTNLKTAKDAGWFFCFHAESNPDSKERREIGYF